MLPNSEIRTVIAKRLALRWIQKVSHLEYRFDILWGPKGLKGLPSLLRSFRDGRTSLGISKVADLGVKDNLDKVSVWSTDRESLIGLKNWLEKRSYETSGVW